jgi:hypothetical protein
MKRGSQIFRVATPPTQENSLNTVQLNNSGSTVDSGNENSISEALEISNVRQAGQSTDLDNLSELSGMENAIINSKTKRALCVRLMANINREVPNLGCVELAAIHTSGVHSVGVLTRITGHIQACKLTTVTTKTKGL